MDKDKFEIICDLVDKLTARKLEEVPHLCIENFSSKLLMNLMKAYHEGEK